MRGRMRKESDDARQDDGKNENSILHVLAFVAFIAFVLAGVYLLVHHACAEKTMKPFLKGEGSAGLSPEALAKLINEMVLR